MAVACELHKTEDDLAHWPVSRIIEWQAFFKLREEAMKSQTHRSPTLMTGKSTVIENM
jgi:hypothetical protein